MNNRPRGSRNINSRRPRQRNDCYTSWEFGPRQLNSYPAYEVDNVAQYDHENDKEDIVERNEQKLENYMDTPKGLKVRRRPNKVIKDGKPVNIQTHCEADLFANKLTGKILAIGSSDEIDPEITYGQNTVKLVLQVLIDYEQFVRRDDPDYRQYHFDIIGQTNPETGRPYPIQTELEYEAIENLAYTVSNFDPVAA